MWCWWNQDVTNPTLFQTMPVINSAGTLRAYLSEDPTGSTSIVVRAVDDGSLYSDAGTNISEPIIITLRLTTGNAEPAFTLAWLTRCAADGRISLSGNRSAVECACSLSTSSPDCLLLHPNLRHVPPCLAAVCCCCCCCSCCCCCFCCTSPAFFSSHLISTSCTLPPKSECIQPRPPTPSQTHPCLIAPCANEQIGKQTASGLGSVGFAPHRERGGS